MSKLYRGLLVLCASLLFSPAVALAQGEGTYHQGVEVTPTHFVAPFDKIPRFCATPTVTSAKTGAWSNPATWSTNTVPTTSDKVLVVAGHTVTYDVVSPARINCIEVQGELTFVKDKNTELHVTHLMIHPQGSFEVGTPAAPIPAAVTARIVINNEPLQTGTTTAPGIDPQQFGNAFIAFGEVTMHGASKNLTFVRLAQEPKAGDTTLTLAQTPTGWQAGDRLVLPDTRQLSTILSRPKDPNSRLDIDYASNQREELSIASMSGAVITLAAPLKYDHLGARDVEGTLEFLPHVGNLTRNVSIASESPTGTRGHVMLLHRAEVDIQYVLFKDLGRTTELPLNNTTFDANKNVTAIGTNQIGRYVLHAHHLYGAVNPANTGYQYVFQGNALDSGRKWGMAIHDSHFGLAKDNVVYNMTGSGIVTEDGSETANLIERNFVVQSSGPPGTKKSFSHLDSGENGEGFWMRSGANMLRDNVAANHRHSGYMFMMTGLGANNRRPLARGVDTRFPEQTEYRAGHRLWPTWEFAGNESYGATLTGYETWNFSPDGNGSVIGRMKKFVAWHHSLTAIDDAYSNPTWEDLIVRGDPVVSLREGERGARGVTARKTEGSATTVKNGNIQGMRVGYFFKHLMPSGHLIDIDGLYLRNQTNFQVRHSFDHYSRGTPFIIRNAKFDSLPGQPLHAIGWSYNESPYQQGNSILASLRVLLYNYQGIADNNFELFGPEQHPDLVPTFTYPPPTRVALCGTEMTNLECFNKYGLTWGGAVASCTDNTTHPEIEAFACPFTGTGRPKPLYPPAPKVVLLSGSLEAKGTQFTAVYYTVGDLTGANSVGFKVDSNPPTIIVRRFAHSYTSEVLSAGQHALTTYLARTDGSTIPGSEVTYPITVGGGSPGTPTLPTSPPKLTVITPA
ncbi:MAG: G8 domain-containing protein, partial [Candidatus Andersenbacteria bacterium]